MSWGTIATLMLPENLLLAGIVLLIGIEIVLRAPARRAGAGARSPCAAAAAAALWLYTTGASAEPFPGHFSVVAGDAAGQGRRAGAGDPGAAHLARRVRRQPVPHPAALLALRRVPAAVHRDSFLTLFIGLEIMSMPVYVLVLLAYRRPEMRRGGAQVPGARRRRHRSAADGRVAAVRRQRDAGDFGLHQGADVHRHDGPRRHRAGDRRLLPQGRGRPLPHLGARCLRGRERAGHRLHGDDRQGRGAARRGAALRRGADAGLDRRPASRCCRWSRSSGATSPRCGSRACGA